MDVTMVNTSTLSELKRMLLTSPEFAHGTRMHLGVASPGETPDSALPLAEYGVLDEHVVLRELSEQCVPTRVFRGSQRLLKNFHVANGKSVVVHLVLPEPIAATLCGESPSPDTNTDTQPRGDSGKLTALSAAVDGHMSCWVQRRLPSEAPSPWPYPASDFVPELPPGLAKIPNTVPTDMTTPAVTGLATPSWPPLHMSWAAGTTPSLDALKVALHDMFPDIPVERIRVAKYSPSKHTWSEISATPPASTGSRRSGKKKRKGKKAAHLRSAPYKMQDGVQLMVLDAGLPGADDDNWMREQDIAFLCELLRTRELRRRDKLYRGKPRGTSGRLVEHALVIGGDSDSEYSDESEGDEE
jgi:hypothetical protein